MVMDKKEKAKKEKAKKVVKQQTVFLRTNQQN